MKFIDLAAKRYSCKKFNPERKVDGAKFERILESGRLAPTAKNLQEQHIYIATSPEALQAIDQCTPCRYGAPIVLVVAFNKNNVYTYPGGKRDSGIEDAAIVATHMMLAAAYDDVDSCWVNNFDPDKLHSMLNLPDDEEILMLLDLGYAAEGTEPLPNHFSRKGIHKTVTRI